VPVVVTVAVAPALGVTVDGLTAHTGGEVVTCAEVTWHDKATDPLNPFTDPTVIAEEEVPPGASASGLKGAATRVNSVVP
jgi:hypothetical protein